MAYVKKLKPKSTSEQNIDDFTGLNILDRPESCKPGELQKAMNIDIDRNLDARRRKGYKSIYSGNVHSLWSDKGPVLFREDRDLRRLNPDMSATTLRGDLALNQRMAFEKIFDKIYFSDELITGITDGLTAWGWGVGTPPQPLIARVSGSMPPGIYRCAMTYMKTDGQESGALGSVQITLTTRGGVYITGIQPSPDPLVAWVNIYLSTPNGERLYRAMSVPNGTTEAIYGGDTKSFNVPLITQFRSRPYHQVLQRQDLHRLERCPLVHGALLLRADEPGSQLHPLRWPDYPSGSRAGRDMDFHKEGNDLLADGGPR